MSVKPEALAQLLAQAVETARGSDTQLTLQTSQRSETENETVHVDIRFGTSDSEPSFVLNRLMNRLEEERTVGSVQLFGPPHSRLELSGAMGARNYRVTIHLQSETPGGP